MTRALLLPLPLLALLSMLACEPRPTEPPVGGPTPLGRTPVTRPAPEPLPKDVRVSSGTFGSIERLDPALDALLPKDAAIEKLAEGFKWTEGPCWLWGSVSEGGSLVFSDIPRNTVFKFDPRARDLSVFIRPSGYTGAAPRGGEPGANGLATDPDGRLVLCQHGDRQVARRNPDGTFTVLASTFEGKRFNSPNDLVFDRAGNLYFTDPPYGLEGNVNDPKKELPFQGVYRLAAADRKLTLLTKDLTFPNGVALSPDEKTLYVAVSDRSAPKYWAYDLKEDGTLGPPRLLFDATALAARPDRKGMPDGLKVDAAGNLWATGPGGVLVLTAQGKHLGTILTGQPTANCNWGDDGSTLYITANMFLCRVRTTTRGKGW